MTDRVCIFENVNLKVPIIPGIVSINASTVLADIMGNNVIIGYEAFRRSPGRFKIPYRYVDNPSSKN